ncbi:uncharacterized protein LOC131437654 [Malaya genurostris]|uniref:uncharacterized protein LOC131437654 n=1 Tax=Malaya genurostris TaxID=325434 RepID=UPI0026F3DCF5|nr:uncharacterized protein LOC131437654 [Malaya genurostris]XP_058463138.1 uncharacterized protein LOC131437654 [Malaya genurostris]
MECNSLDTSSDGCREEGNSCESRKRFRNHKRFRSTFSLFGRSNQSIRCENILLKVLNRQHCGYFNTGLNQRSNRAAFRQVPDHLSFCLKDIVPYCYLQGHVFMGLSACGQFLVSYKVAYDYDEEITHEYNFSSNYKYELYFWIYRPHFLLSKYFQVCLFDDHGVDDIKTVSITQWNTDQQLLIVHGASEKEDFDSYITVVRVPKLGCLECKKLRDADEEESNRQDILCIKCNMTIHTKYRNSDSGPKFNPRFNLNCPGYIIMSENSFIHTVNINLDMHRCPQKRPSGVISSKYISKSHGDRQRNEETSPAVVSPTSEMVIDMTLEPVKPLTGGGCPSTSPEPQTSISIADQIIADFAEYETETFESKCSQPLSPLHRTTSRLSSNASHSSTTTHYPENFDELVITCDHRGSGVHPPRSSIVTRGAAARMESLSPSSNVRLVNHRNNTNVEIRLTSPENRGPKSSIVTRVDLQAGPSSSAGTTASMRFAAAKSNAQHLSIPVVKPEPCESTSSSSSSTGRTPLRRRSYLSTRATESNVPSNSNQPDSGEGASTDVASRAYEFSEDNERCEKISTFRKRRLADKKYEFSEDSSHGDSVIVPFNRLRSQIRTRSAASQSVLYSPSHLVGYEMSTHLHRASPNHGFRSPCGSPVGNRYLRSPPGIRSPNYYRHHSPVATPPTGPNRPPCAAQLLKMSNFDPKDYIHTSGGSGSDEIPKFFIDAIQKFNEKKLQADGGGGNDENVNSDNLPMPAKTDPNGTALELKPERPVCSKKIVKIYVEEDDANSVLTTEDDDCISPGYHASLPMEVHGSCYSNMQIVTPASYSKLNCPAVVVTQNSFDMETFSFHVANYICTKNDKKYGILFDSAYELTHVCPLTETITCTMVLQFTASDTNKLKQCHNCSTTIDCHTHRKIYQCRSLFTWNMTTGDWTVLDYGSLSSGPYLELKKLASNYSRLLVKLRKFTRKLFASSSNERDTVRTYEYLNHLRVLDSNNEKTKQRLIDLEHMIEFYRKQINDPDDSDDSDEDSSSSIGSSRNDDDDDEANTVVGDTLTSDTVSDEDDI